MYVGSDMGPGTTSQNDPRVTTIGKFLRKYKIDELPQFFNVLMGQMSVVGPRPELPKYTKNYTGQELLILTVKPGITDYASIHFSNLNDLVIDHDPDSYFENHFLRQKNSLRIKYVEDQSFMLDLMIIFNTLIKLSRLNK